jgi:hypothetical protein
MESSAVWDCDNMTKKEKERYQLDRIIVGNQISIMRALAQAAESGSSAHRDLTRRAIDIKEWWRSTYGEEVGFSTAWGDQPPR